MIVRKGENEILNVSSESRSSGVRGSLEKRGVFGDREISSGVKRGVGLLRRVQVMELGMCYRI